jgi:tetratricopeptide (TPR) repeat protein
MSRVLAGTVPATVSVEDHNRGENIMTQFGHCPACGDNIPQDRYVGESVICRCGWSNSTKAKKEVAKQTDRTILAIAVFAAFIVASFIQVVNWDKYFFSIIPLKSKQMLSLASTTDFVRIAEICMERKKFDCAEQAYFGAYEANPKDLTHLEKLGDLQVRQELMLSATKTYDTYFASGGANIDAKYNYAKALAATNNTEKAEQYFREVLMAKPDTLQITVTRHYIEMLVKNNDLQKAKRVIEHFRKQGFNTSLFMKKEYEEIQQKLSRKVANF